MPAYGSVGGVRADMDETPRREAEHGVLIVAALLVLLAGMRLLARSLGAG